MKNIATHLGLAMLILFLLSLGGSRWLTERNREHNVDQHVVMQFSNVYVHHGDFVPNVPFHAGDFMFAHYTIIRTRACTVDIQFRLAMPRRGDRYTGLFSYGYPMIRYYGPPNKLETNEYMTIPIGMPPGIYELRRMNFIDCGYGYRSVEFAPAATLTIVK